MYSNLILYKNELRKKTIPKYKIIGIVTELIYSKDIFIKNKDIEKFMQEVFGIKVKRYVIKSRNMINSKVIKFIISSRNTNYYKNKLINFISLQIEAMKKNKVIEERKNELDGWIK